MEERESNLSKNNIKYLHQGTFGCIFRPALSCKGDIEKKPGYITKIQEQKDISDRETENSNKIKLIQGYGNFFAPILKTCSISIGMIKNDEIKKCDFLQKNTQENFISNKIKYVSKYTLQDYLFYILKNKPDLFINTFLESYLYLLNSIDKLFNANIIHYDLKENNIMYDVKHNRPIIIDFGLSFDMNDLTTRKDFMNKAFYVYTTDYPPWCIDIIIISFIVNEIDNVNSKINVKMLNSIVEYLTITNPIFMKLMLSGEISLFKNKMNEYFLSMQSKTYQELIQELLKFANSWDNYSLAVIFLFIIHYLKINEYSNDYFFLGNIIKFYKNIILSTPNKRPTIITTLQGFNNIISEIDDDDIDKNIETSLVYKLTMKSKNDKNFLNDVNIQIQDSKKLDGDLEKKVYK